MNLTGKSRRKLRDVWQWVDTAQFNRLCWTLSFAGFLVIAVLMLVSGHVLVAVCDAGAALVPAGLAVAATRRIRDRKAGRPL